MHPFRYTLASDEAAACAFVLAEEQAMFIAGGTTLVDLMKINVETPTHLIDITVLPLAEITASDTGVRIGALARNSDIAYHPLIQEHYPILSQAILSGASAQLRNMATLGGNLMQRVRCPYFRNVAMACNKRVPASGCSALQGYNREHAILGGSAHCIATHPSDLCVALVALDASVQTRGVQGERRILLTDFYPQPGEHPEHETVLERGELITSVDVPSLPTDVRSLYKKVRDRTSYAFALASIAVVIKVQNGLIQFIRMALGGVATKPWRVYEAEEFLLGRPAQEENYQIAAALAVQDAIPQRDNGFKIDLTRRMIVHALNTVGRAE